MSEPIEAESKASNASKEDTLQILNQLQQLLSNAPEDTRFDVEIEIKSND